MKKFKWLSLPLFLAMGLCGKEMVTNGDFENGKTAPWKPYGKTQSKMEVISEQSPGGGSYVLAIHIQPGERTAIFHQNINLPPGKYKFSFLVDTTRFIKPAGYVLAYISGSLNGKWKNYGGINTPGTPKTGWKKDEWSKYERIVDIPEGGKAGSLWLQCCNYCTGTALVDNISIVPYGEKDAAKDEKVKEEKARAAAAQKTAMKALFTQGGVGSMYLPDQVPELTFKFTNPAKVSRTVAVTFRTTDYFGKKVLENKKTFTVEPGKTVSEVLHYPELKKNGFYCTTASWTCDGVAGMAQGTFIKVTPPPEKPDPAFGISYFAAVDAPRWKRLGAGTKGVLVSWKYWNKPGTKENLLQAIDKLRKEGITVFGGFYAGVRDTPPSYLNKKAPKNVYPVIDPEKRLRALEAFVKDAVTVTKGKIAEWTIVEEINLTANIAPYNRQHYIDTVRCIYKAVKAADPSVPMLAMGCSGADGREKPRYKFIRGMLPDLKGYMDGFGIDQYTGGQVYGKGYVNLNSEETEFRDILLTAVKIANDNGMSRVSVDEKGPSIVRKEPYTSQLDITMADNVAREFIVLKTVPQVRHWLYFRPDNWDKTSKIDYGMWESGNPRHTAAAFAFTSRIMGQAEFVKGLHPHKDLQCWLFRKNGKALASLWYNGRKPLKVELPGDAKVEIADIQGNPVELKDNSFEVGFSPLYLTAGSTDAMEKIIRNVKIDIPELEILLENQVADKDLLLIRNVSGTRVSMTVKDRKLALNPGEIRAVEFPRKDVVSTYDVVTENGRKYTVSGEFKPVKVPRVSGFKELAALKPILLNDPNAQTPGYADLKAHSMYRNLDDLSAEFRFGYDDKFFYIDALVKDDCHVNEQAPGRCFHGDCIQYAFDTRRDGRLQLLRGNRGFVDDDFSIISALADGKNVTYFFSASKESSEGLLKTEPVITRDEKTKTTHYQVKIPFENLAPLKPVKGKIFGFSFLVFDVDNDTKGLYWIQYTTGIAGNPNPAVLPAFLFD